MISARRRGLKAREACGLAEMVSANSVPGSQVIHDAH